MKSPFFLIALLMASLATLHSADQPPPSTKPDRVLADFEQGYGDWKAKGEAFNHPATDICGGVKGFAGEGPGGLFSQFLGIEDKSAPNPPDDCPAFQLQDVPLPTFKPNERGWNDRAPKNFSGKKTIFKG